MPPHAYFHMPIASEFRDEACDCRTPLFLLCRSLEQILCTGKSDVNFSMNQYLSKIDSLLEIHAPLKKLNKKEVKFLTKSWITQGLQNSVKK